MHSLWIIFALLAAFVVAYDSSLPPELLMEQLQSEYSIATKRHLPKEGACTADNIKVRKEWGAMCNDERKEYIDAILCLQKLPAKTSRKVAPGARSRWDDFVVAHLKQTLVIHWTGRLFPWHRYLITALETAMREECGFTGSQPYWDWSKYAFMDWHDIPMIDGSEFSLSGNGKAIKHGQIINTLPGGAPPRGSIAVPPGLGGGCIDGGPLASIRANLGPVRPTQNSTDYSYGLKYNPRCVTRDFNPPFLHTTNTYKNVTDLLLDHHTLASFQTRLEALDGVHPNGHLFVGGANHDLFVSPNDPLFFLHHAQIDRMWSIWQSRHYAEREYEVAKTITFLNYPPSRNFTLEDTLELSEVFDVIKAKDVMSTFKGGRQCYMYV